MLRVALASIRALETPDLQFEILVGNNGPEKEGCAIASEFGARCLQATEQKGPSAARNAAMSEATGDYIAFLDDDDVWLSGNIRSQLSLLDQRPDIDAVMGQVVYTDAGLKPVSQPFPAEAPSEGDALLKRMLSGWFPQLGTVVARASVLKTYGKFDPLLLGGEDLDWLLRIARKRRLAFVKTPSILFRARPPGTYDDLNRDRIKYDRRVFMRHAVAEWRLWSSPMDFSKAYSGTLMHFYDYFLDAAESRASRGDRSAALKAALVAVGIFPARAMWQMLRPTRLRRSVVQVLSPWRRTTG